MNLKEQIINLLQDVSSGLPYLDAKKELENFNFWEDDDTLSDEEQEELGGLISEGCTSGRLDSEDGTCVAWQLNWNKWKE